MCLWPKNELPCFLLWVFIIQKGHNDGFKTIKASFFKNLFQTLTKVTCHEDEISWMVIVSICLLFSFSPYSVCRKWQNSLKRSTANSILHFKGPTPLFGSIFSSYINSSIQSKSDLRRIKPCEKDKKRTYSFLPSIKPFSLPNLVLSCDRITSAK